MKHFFSVIFCITILTGIITIQSCDKIDPPYKETNDIPDDTSKVRKFLLEEFTGHTCPNCPQGAIIAQGLKDYYGDRLILMTIHYGGFAETGPSPFQYDFTSATGNEIGSFFSLGMFPSGMVSRNGWTSTENNADIGKDAWGPRIETLKNLQPTVSIEVTNTWNSGTREVDASVECDALTDIDATYKIAVYITEDSIIKAQQTLDTIWHNYVHRHVLRGSMNGTWGDTLITASASTGDEFVRNFSSTLDSDWNEDHCYLIVLVYDAENYEIMQVEEKKIN